MGAATFWVEAEGFNPQEAFKAAVENAQYTKGHGGYTGTIAEKHSFRDIRVPQGEDPRKHAQALMDKDDRRISDKWGPAGCVLVEQGSGPKKPKQCKVHNKTKSGRKQWDTVYQLVTFDWDKTRDIIVAEEDTKTQAIKTARQHALAMDAKIRVVIAKKLTSHDKVEAVVEPKPLKHPPKPNTYLFFGWAPE